MQDGGNFTRRSECFVGRCVGTALGPRSTISSCHVDRRSIDSAAKGRMVNTRVVGWKPVQVRHGRATVIGPLGRESDPFRGEACLNTGTRYPQGVRHDGFNIGSRRPGPLRSPFANCFPGSFSPAFSACSAFISSARKKAPPRSSRACTCMNSCTTAAICSASPATKGVGGIGLRRRGTASGTMSWLSRPALSSHDAVGASLR